MSFLAEVLSSAELIELDEINRKVPELKLTIENMKNEVIRYTENVYVKYSGRPRHNRVLLTKATEIEEELKTLKKNAEHATKKSLLEADDQFKQHLVSLEAINFTLHIVSNMCQLNEQLIKFTELFDSKMYLECMKLICNLTDLVNQIPNEESLDIIEEIKMSIDTNMNMLLNEVKNIFTSNVTIVENKKTNSIMVKIRKDNNNLEQALQALYYKNSVIYPLHSFAKSLWNFVFMPIVDYVVNINTDEDDRFHILNIITQDSLRKSDYLKVFTSLKIVLDFLSKHFNIKINDEVTTLAYVGMDIRDNLSELIIKHCLQDTIPSTTEELQKYNVVIEDTKLLENKLRDCDIFAEDTASIFEYANNIDILFINKKCQNYLLKSQENMKKDLHDMVEVGTPYNPENPLGCNVDEFLQCSVSVSTVELLQFTEKILQESIVASDVCAGRLFCTVQNIFRKYSNYVPEYHKKLLQTIPQQVALFHNNCFYIAYKLTQWNQVYSSKMSHALNTENCAFRDEIFQLQKVASEIFTDYVEKQTKQIIEIMKDSELDGPTLEKLQPITEKCIRQCLRQQELLRTVWQKVLSYPVYNKTLGVILNTLCNSLINSIVKFEDISSNAAEQLVEIIKIVVTRGPKLFTDSKEVNLYVSIWYKLTELNFVLGASLLDINDRWADGKGPLALQFKPSELKQLIRALFQNTDRRSAVLARIQE